MSNEVRPDPELLVKHLAEEENLTPPSDVGQSCLQVCQFGLLGSLLTSRLVVKVSEVTLAQTIDDT